MASFDWEIEEENELEFGSESVSAFEKRKKNQQLKRKWREIETIKENRRLKRELADLNVSDWT